VTVVSARPSAAAASLHSAAVWILTNPDDSQLPLEMREYHPEDPAPRPEKVPAAHAWQLESPSPKNPALQTHALRSPLPAGEKASALQALQLDIPSPQKPALQKHARIEVLPAGELASPTQDVQLEIPSSTLEKKPALHLQLLLMLLPGGESELARGQGSQLANEAAPVSLWNVPAGQSEHADDPGFPAYVPAPHDEHDVGPSTEFTQTSMVSLGGLSLPQLRCTPYNHVVFTVLRPDTSAALLSADAHRSVDDPSESRPSCHLPIPSSGS
jgi:hypothetical protein